MKRLARMLVLLPLVLTGCATGALWGNRDFREPNKPAGLALFQSADAQRVLVQYDETCDSNDRVNRRAYWLTLGEKPARNPHKPFFVPVEQSHALLPIAVLEPPDTNAFGTMGLCAVASTNDIAFTLFSNGQVLAAHRLPVYEDAAGRSKRIMLTPLAVAADATIVGGFIFLSCWADGGFEDEY